MRNKQSKIDILVKMGILTAISCVLILLIRIPFPPMPIFVYDAADIPIYISAFAFGPLVGLVITFAVSFIQAFMLGGDGVYGFIMHVVATGSFCLVAGLIYKLNKTKKGATVGLIAGIVVMTVIMCCANLVVTPAFLGVPTKAVIAMIPTAIIPFNIMKGTINAIVTFLIYKRISGFLHRQR